MSPLSLVSRILLCTSVAGAAGGGPAPGGRITILVSHRFSTVRMADFIVVLDGARVAEQGTHDQLLALGGTYAELYSVQFDTTPAKAAP